MNKWNTPEIKEALIQETEKVQHCPKGKNNDCNDENRPYCSLIGRHCKYPGTCEYKVTVNGLS